MHNPCSIAVFERYPMVDYAVPVSRGKLGRSRIGATILLVAGDPLFRHYLKGSLHEAGYVVYAVSNPQEAMAIQAKVAIDLVIVDDKLLETASFISCSFQYLPHEVPVIAMMSSNSPENIITALMAGVDDYVAKPFSFSQIMSCIKKQLLTPILA